MKELYNQLAAAVVSMKPDEVRHISHQVLNLGYSPEDAIQQGLAKGMTEVGRLFASKEYFVPEVLVCAKTMYVGFDILKDEVVDGKINNKGTIVIGVVDGDFHDIGKNIVKLMLEASGFRMIDLGKNVSLDSFKEAVKDNNPEIVALSTLMTTTMDSMEEIVHALIQDFPTLKLMVGGAPVNNYFAKTVGAHFYGIDATNAVNGAHQLMGISL
jgi:dimethylamine corrinoid protein